MSASLVERLRDRANDKRAMPKPFNLLLDAAEEIDRMHRELAETRAINANLMGDEESVPRYSTKRLHQEIDRARKVALIDAAEIAERLASEEDEEWRSDCGSTVETRLAGARSWAFGRIRNLLFDKAEETRT